MLKTITPIDNTIYVERQYASNEDIENSLRWCLQRGNRTGRSAWQYIIELAAIKNLKIIF